MEQFVRVTGIAVPMLRINVDTDQIVPGPELLRVRTEGHAASLFAGARYRQDREPNPEFILNREPWSRAQILLADRNFGCGSSREAAPKALREYGFRALIAPSFGGIFFNNCFRNGLLPVELPIEAVRLLAGQMEAAQGNAAVTVDLEVQRVTAPDGTAFAFTAPATLRRMLLEGVDEIDLTLSRGAEIARFRSQDEARRPWAY
ncbi:MAG: 3-isopropylmalate dehydratase small subunit [Alphaproteobacteria bacterium]|nr:3-isopropylmalate dehydratase small subunit [Alphaproteobacteria bacterium]